MPQLPPPPRPAARAVFAYRRLARRLLDRLLPPEAALWEHSMGLARTRMLGALAEHGVADELAKGAATAAQLAARLDLDADALHRVLRACALDGIVRLDRRGRFRLGYPGRALREDHPRSVRPWIRYLNFPSTQDAWGGVTDTLRTGEPSFPAVHGSSVWDHFAAHPDEERVFAESMRKLTEISLPSVVRRYPWPEEGTVCDVAGGVGTLLAGILRARPKVRGVLVDGPGVLAEAEAHLDQVGLRDRVTLSPGNMFERIDARAEYYVLKDILHDWDDERCLTILRTVRAAMPDGARVVLVESLQEPNALESISSLIDVHMLTQCDGGRQRSAAELHELMRQSRIRPGGVQLTEQMALVDGVAS
jgi:O-methyltransferase domain